MNINKNKKYNFIVTVNSVEAINKFNENEKYYFHEWSASIDKTRFLIIANNFIDKETYNKYISDLNTCVTFRTRNSPDALYILESLKHITETTVPCINLNEEQCRYMREAFKYYKANNNTDSIEFNNCIWGLNILFRDAISLIVEPSAN